MIWRDERGYSMVEVLVAILILVIAIVPMFAMFDLGLRTATTNSNYDKARALAEKQMELAQSVDYETVRDGFPSVRAGSPPSGCLVTGSPNSTATDCLEPAYPNLEYEVDKTYLKLPTPAGAASDIVLEESLTDEDMIQLEICVYREGGSCADYIFKTTGIVAEQVEE